jgi:hypothetical protein
MNNALDLTPISRIFAKSLRVMGAAKFNHITFAILNNFSAFDDVAIAKSYFPSRY